MLMVLGHPQHLAPTGRIDDTGGCHECRTNPMVDTDAAGAFRFPGRPQLSTLTRGALRPGHRKIEATKRISHVQALMRAAKSSTNDH
jgi:hypothetical protein